MGLVMMSMFGGDSKAKVDVFVPDWEGTKYPNPTVSLTDKYFCTGAQTGKSCNRDNILHPQVELRKRVMDISDKEITDDVRDMREAGMISTKRSSFTETYQKSSRLETVTRIE